MKYIVMPLSEVTVSTLALISPLGLDEHIAMNGEFGVLDFGAFFGELHVPHLVSFDLRGWSCSLDQMECFLLRHLCTSLWARSIQIHDPRGASLGCGEEIRARDIRRNKP